MAVSDRLKRKVTTMTWEELEVVVERCRRGLKSRKIDTQIKSGQLLVLARMEQLKRFPEKYGGASEEFVS